MDEALIKRVPPHSIEAEQSVVGAILMDRDAITVAAEIICGDDFYQKAYGVIFDSVVELFNEGKPVDLITLQNRLREKAVPEEISSLEFVRDLVTAVPTSANVKYYAEIVSEKATLRRLIKMNEAIADECYQGQEPLEAILERTEKQVFELVQNRGGNGEYVPIKHRSGYTICLRGFTCIKLIRFPFRIRELNNLPLVITFVRIIHKRHIRLETDIPTEALPHTSYRDSIRRFDRIRVSREKLHSFLRGYRRGIYWLGRRFRRL